jgi:small nuclear ribonucleoprotein (snRNP)-like protein
MIMNLVPARLAADDIACRIAAMPAGTRVEVRLKSNETLRGSMGAVSSSGFTLLDSKAGAHQVAFSEVASVQQTNAKRSHMKRNVLAEG